MFTNVCANSLFKFFEIIDFIESKGWCFGGCDRKIIDAYYIDAQGNPIEEVG